MKDLLTFFDKPKDPLALNAVRISIASPERIKKWSFGEVKKPETINYRTFKPEREGLFCCKIFGPQKDYECLCGKYKGMKYRGVICEKCGTEITKSKVRRERFGHIELAAPVAHIWFLRSLSSRIATLLGAPVKDVQKILYCERHVVLNPMDTSLKKHQLLTDEDYEEALDEFGPHFETGMGGEAVRDMIKDMDMEFLARKLRKDLSETSSETAAKKLSKRLKIIEDFQQSVNKPHWMMLEVLPVIPPDLRPLVLLDGGRFAASDLNDLYRRVINRNNRLKKLQELNAPEIIIRNEKRMLQESVDALMDNGKGGKVFTGSNKRPLKSLSDALKGKQGRFRQNLLGKRVDYSGRSVIVVGPHLKLHECGLPKTMALELFKPFIYHKLEERGVTVTIKQARTLVEQQTDEVWDILSETVKEHPVLLNRAPTLHRLGIQAFEPVLHEGKAIQLHPLVCTAFNADFDGDQMAVHVPLSVEAQAEARVLIMSTNNILSPANGRPVINPTQDVVLGMYWMTRIRPGAKGEGKRFGSVSEVLYACETAVVDLQAAVKCRIQGNWEETSVGRAVLSAVVPEQVPFSLCNRVMNKKALAELIDQTFRLCGGKQTALLSDKLMNYGFHYATKAGISIGIGDLQIPSQKEELISKAEKQVEEIRNQYNEGLITEGERFNKVTDIWTSCADQAASAMMEHLEKETFEVHNRKGGRQKIEAASFNPIFIMADSGARGSPAQIRQLAGMRGLMAKPSGEVIETPITSNFREGLTVLQYFISTHGARKGSADTALKTSASGYLTRRLVEVSQDVIVSEEDCRADDCIEVRSLMESGGLIQSAGERALGRTAFEDIVDPHSNETICQEGREIDEKAAAKIERAGLEGVRIRSPLTCRSVRGVCVKCYGRDLSLGRTVSIGEAVGIIAAQSIGEPGTQLTMRTFHLGGAASRSVEQSFYKARYSGRLKFHNLSVVKNREGKLTASSRNGEAIVLDETGRERERFPVVYGAALHFKEGDKISPDQVIAEWDPYSIVIISDVSGKVKFINMEESGPGGGGALEEQLDAATGFTAKVITEIRAGDRKPSIAVVDEKGAHLKFPGRDSYVNYTLSAGMQVMVSDGDAIHAGDVIAKRHREIAKTKDITGGLPRVAELLEARKPKEAAILSESDGYVSFGKDYKGKQRLIVTTEKGEKKEYLIPKGKYVSAREGEFVRKGEALMDGLSDPHDILKISGEKALAYYLTDEVQEVYRLQGVSINDKHIELIVRQMLRKAEVTDSGDTGYITGQRADRHELEEINNKTIKEGGRPASFKPLLLGITKTSLNTQSWLSAASFQETSRVLTEAAVQSRVDHLSGLKENVIMGRLIPAGTGFKAYRNRAVGYKKEAALAARRTDFQQTDFQQTDFQQTASRETESRETAHPETAGPAGDWTAGIWPAAAGRASSKEAPAEGSSAGGSPTGSLKGADSQRTGNVMPPSQAAESGEAQPGKNENAGGSSTGSAGGSGPGGVRGSASAAAPGFGINRQTALAKTAASDRRPGEAETADKPSAKPAAKNN